jgi:uncharacterized membrane protein
MENNFMEENKQEQKIEAPVANQSTENKQNNTTEIDNDTTWGIIAYIIFFLPLIVIPKRSAFLNYHINQGLILFIFGVGGSVIINALGLYAFSSLYLLAIVVLAVMGIINVNKKEMKPLPLIGGILHLIK